MRLLSPLAVLFGIVFGMSGSAQAGHLWHSFSVCKQTCDPCPTCPNACHSIGCQMSLHLACLDSTCDMYPHYAYFPECHGSYYFRPYNWEHYAQDTAFMLGLGHAAPYSEDGMADLKPTVVPEQPIIRVRHKKLPNLEAMLAKQPSVKQPELAAPPPPRPAE